MERRTLFVNRFYWPDESATAQILTDLAEGLAEAGDSRIEVLTSRQKYTDAAASLCALEVHNRVTIRRLWSTAFGRSSLPLRALDYATFYLSVLLHLLFAARRSDTIVLKTDPPMLPLIGALVRLFRRARLMHWSQDVFPEIAFAGKKGDSTPPRESLLERFLRQIRNLGLGAHQKVIAICQDMRTHFEGQGIERSRLVVIHNWSDEDGVRPIPQTQNPLRDEWSLKGQFVLGYSGNLGRVHEYRTLLQAARILVDNDSIRFLFVGSGALREKLEAEIDPALRERFLLQPYQPRSCLDRSLSLPDVHWLSLLPQYTPFVFPSKFFGITAAGRPAIFIGAPGCELAEIIGRERIGWVFEPGQDRALARKLEELAAPEARSLLDETGQRARLWFEREGTRARAISQWNELLRME